jgi:hypothetical protein
MSAYLLAVVWDRPNTRGQVQRVRPHGQRFVEHPVAADAPDAHASRAPAPEPPRNRLASPEETGHQLGKIISRRLKEDYGDSTATGQLHKPWSRPDRVGRQPSESSRTRGLFV